MRGVIESQQLTAASTLQELQDLRGKLATEAREASER
jgi:hypothetical protein